MSAEKKNWDQLRREYTRQELSRKEVLPHPFHQFEKWLREALETEVPDPNAMTLCTVGPTGQPTARIVLLKDVDEKGFVFYTNYHSLKGTQIRENPFVSLSFFWQQLERQVRIEGKAELLSAAASDAYFQSRPRGSRLAAIASPQSREIENREWLEEEWARLAALYPDPTPIPRPENWGGYRVIPQKLEFWQGRNNRLHDRIVYERTSWEEASPGSEQAAKWNPAQKPAGQLPGAPGGLKTAPEQANWAIRRIAP